MKKFILFLCTLLCVTFAFAGCTSAPTPSKTNRWENGETLNYRVELTKTLVDTTNVEFQKFTYPNLQGAQLAPDEAKGTYKTTITKNSQGQYELKSSFEVVETYLKQDLPEASTFADCADIVTETADTYAFRSTMESTVVFESFPTGTPIRSEKVVNGAYVYRKTLTETAVLRNHFQATANYEANKCATKIMQYNTATNQFDTPLKAEKVVEFSGTVYDNEQLYFAVRALNMETLLTSSSTNFQILNAVEQRLQPIMVQTAAKTIIDVEANAVVYPSYSLMMGISEAGKSGGAVQMYFDSASTIDAGTAGYVPAQPLVRMAQGHLTYKLVR